jgi:hypothetical protein
VLALPSLPAAGPRLPPPLSHPQHVEAAAVSVHAGLPGAAVVAGSSSDPSFCPPVPDGPFGGDPPLPEWTQVEFCAYMTHFADMDSDGDGFITPEDLQAYALDLGYDITDKQVWELIDDKDVDGDGVISIRDYLLATQRRLPEDEEYFHHWMFHVCVRHILAFGLSLRLKSLVVSLCCFFSCLRAHQYFGTMTSGMPVMHPADFQRFLRSSGLAQPFSLTGFLQMFATAK